MPMAVVTYPARAFTLVAAAIVGCRAISAPPPAARAYQPPSQYALWWRVVERCSGASRPFGSIHWAIVPGVSAFDAGPMRGLAGAWYPEQNEIVMAARDTSRSDEVRHEMLHAILSNGNHPRSYFYDACGGYVSCAGPCATEVAVDSSPLPSAVVVDRRALELSVSIFPDTVAISPNGGPYVATTAIHNPFPYAVRVPLVPIRDDPTAVATLGFVLPLNRGVGYATTNRTFMDLRPGETRRWVYDDDARGLPVGPLTVYGFFNVDSVTTRMVIQP